MAVTLTKIISKVVNTSVVVLFKHANQLLLPSTHMTISKNHCGLRTYLSDWYVIDPIQEEVLDVLSGWYFGNFSNESLDDFLFDWICVMARPYFLSSKEYKYEYKHSNSNSYGKSLYGWHKGNDVIGDQRNDRCFNERDSFIESDAHYLYGYDYVSVEECFEVLEDSDDWAKMDMEIILEETEFVSSDKNGFRQLTSRQIKPDRNDINSINEDVFSDAIKLLDYIETIEKKT